MARPRWSLITITSLTVLALVAPPAAAQPPPRVPVADPIPADPAPADFALVLEEYAAFPRSEPVPAPVDPRLVRQARINHLGELPDGSGRRYVPDLNGSLYLLDAAGGEPREYLDVRERVGADFLSGRGLGSGFGFVTFHPGFAGNGRFYTVHTEAFAALTGKTPDLYAQPQPSVHSVITEWTAADPGAETFTGTSRELLRIAFANRFHTVQQIDFNPTARPQDADYGLLYLAVGDGGLGTSTADPQDLGVPQGKILRIDPAGTDGGNGRYGVPPANPFVGRPGALGEIYAYGMRDPHRFSWNPRGRHQMYLGHIGEHDIEGIYEVRSGDNLGWSDREGAFVFDRSAPCDVYPLPPDDAGYTYPVAAYDHDAPADLPCDADSGNAVSGGVVYAGRAAPALRGTYVFTDIVDGRIFLAEQRRMRRGGELAPLRDVRVVDAQGRVVTVQQLVGDERVDLRVGADRSGELYLLSKSDGRVWRVTGTRPLPAPEPVLPALRDDLVAYYDFEHPVSGDLAREQDQGRSGTDLDLVNGGAAMRAPDGAHPGSTTSLQTRQVEPAGIGDDDWKAGVYAPGGVPTLRDFNGATGVTVAGWFKTTGENPALNSETPDPADRYNAVGLAGVLSGGSDGHVVRALLEVVDVGGQLKLVALGRRIDGSGSLTFAATEDWRTLLPRDEWVFLAGTFDFRLGTMALYRNGEPVAGSYSPTGDPWQVDGSGTSPTDPAGLKIGGSFPQDTVERNPCDCRMDSLMFLDRVVSAEDVRRQYLLATGGA